MILTFKIGVDITGIKEPTIIMIHHVADAFAAAGYDTVVTSVVDGKHMTDSLHYDGCAADFRTRHVKTKKELTAILADAKKRCGNAYDIIIETDHIHGEFQPT
jgi:hypothetical protein